LGNFRIAGDSGARRKCSMTTSQEASLPRGVIAPQQSI
jgi:hypothetical protein